MIYLCASLCGEKSTVVPLICMESDNMKQLLPVESISSRMLSISTGVLLCWNYFKIFLFAELKPCNMAICIFMKLMYTWYVTCICFF